MKIHRSEDNIHVELTIAEARVLLDELAHVRGGARLPKIRQVCAGLETTLELSAWQELRKREQKYARPIPVEQSKP